MEQLNQIFQTPQGVFLLLWSLFWKGWALWRAAKNDQKVWYVAILLINLMGILEITYLLFFQKEGKLWHKIFIPKKDKKN